MRRVVDAVAGHGDDTALARQLLDHRAFLIGKDVGFDFGNAETPGDRHRGGAVVAGQHDHADVRLGQSFERRRSRRLDRLGDGENAGGLAVDGEENRRGAVITLRLRRLVQSGGIDAQFGESKPRTGARSRLRSAAAFAIAAASGCSLPRSTLAAMRSTSSSV